MSINRETTLNPISLCFGLLIMTFPGPRPDASDSIHRGKPMITDFSSDTRDLGWYTQNDNVMGGRSKGGFELGQGELIFAGSTNTNGGGFSSIRTQAFELDLSNHDGVQLRVKGDGRRYTWQLQTNARYRGYPVSYWAEFGTRDGEWSTVNIPFSSFYPQFRGFKLDGPELDPSEITELGLYIYDKQDGPFELHLDSVQAYSAETPSVSDKPSKRISMLESRFDRFISN
jgi:NADH dehydrogenase [ubiquinone] 1 alpha subcomplex assembly factor 1